MDNRPWHRFYEKGVAPDVAFEEKTLSQILESAAVRFPTRTATVFEGGRLTYAELKDAVDRLATALVHFGVRPGDRVAIMLPNLPQTVIAWFGVLRAGGVAVMTNPMYVGREVEHQFNDSGAKVAIVLDAMWMKTVRPVRSRLKLEHVIVTGIKDFLPFPKNLLFPLVGKKTGLVVETPREAGVHLLAELLGLWQPAPPPMPRDLDALGCLQYTGGTTGVSKAAMLTHRNLSYNAQQTLAWFTGVSTGGEVMLSALPFFHVFGLTVCMNLSVLIGATQVIVPNPRDIDKLIGLIAKHRPTLFPAVPALFHAIANHPDVAKFDLSSIKGCFSGSAPLPMEVLEQFEKLTGGKITEGFGLTESSPVTHANPLYGQRKAGSIGTPLPNTDCRIVDLEDGVKDVAPGAEGELILRGPQVMKGYWKRDDETALTLRDGWLYTGDIGRMDDDGYFYIVGRKKEMIIVGGYNVYPREIDEILYEHPKVLEAAAIGLPDARKGESVKVFVVLKPGERLSEQEVVDYCRSRLAPYKVPKAVEFRGELPKSAVGKILRRVLRDEELATRKAAAVQPAGM